MTLMWLTDDQNEYKGWKIAYEFINDDAGILFIYLNISLKKP